MVIIMSIINDLVEMSAMTNSVAIKEFNSTTALLQSIEIGSGDDSRNGSRKLIEVWLHLRRPISENECAEFKAIIEANDCEDSHVPYGVYETYDYHLPSFPKAWMEDIFPRLVKII